MRLVHQGALWAMLPDFLKGKNMRVKELHLANGVYVNVKDERHDIDFRLRDGLAPKQSLIEDALDFRKQAARLLVLAQIAEQAAEHY